MTDLDKLGALLVSWPCHHGPHMCSVCWEASPFPELLAVARAAATPRPDSCLPPDELWCPLCEELAPSHEATCPVGALIAKLAEVTDD